MSPLSRNHDHRLGSEPGARWFTRDEFISICGGRLSAAAQTILACGRITPLMTLVAANAFLAQGAGMGRLGSRLLSRMIGRDEKNVRKALKKLREEGFLGIGDDALWRFASPDCWQAAQGQKPYGESKELGGGNVGLLDRAFRADDPTNPSGSTQIAIEDRECESLLTHACAREAKNEEQPASELGLVASLCRILGESDRRTWSQLDRLAIGYSLIGGEREQVKARLLQMAQSVVENQSGSPAKDFIDACRKEWPALATSWPKRLIPAHEAF